MSPSHQLVGGQRQDTEHQVSHHLGVPRAPDRIAAELVLEPGIAALGNSTLVGADGFGRSKFDLLATARVGVDQGNVSQAVTRVAQLGTAISGVHQIVEVGDALGADQQQGYRRQAVMHRCRGAA